MRNQSYGLGFATGFLLACLVAGFIIQHQSKPICDDLVRYPADQSHQLVCERGLGNIPEDEAQVRMSN